MGLLRSEKVELYDVIIPKDNDWEIMSELGAMNCLHFIDLNKQEQPHLLRYFNQVRRCEEAEKIIIHLETICAKHQVEMKSPAGVSEFVQQVDNFIKERGKAAHLLFTDIENDLIEKDRFLEQQGSGLEQMIEGYLNIIARISIFRQSQKLITEQTQKLDSERSAIASPKIENKLDTPLLNEYRTQITYFGGILERKSLLSFKKLLFRATRGKVFAQFFPMNLKPEDLLPNSKNYDQEMTVYIVMFEEGDYLRERISKICQTTQHPVFEIKKEEINRSLESLEKHKIETKTLIHETRRQLRQYLISINRMESSNELSLIKVYKWFILKEKSIYVELNKLKDGDKILMGLFWCAESMKEDFERRLNTFRQEKDIGGPQIHQIENFDEKLFIRPTLIQQNEFTWVFQEIVNTYAVPQYQEINPALFTIVTFPFLFGVMFGDVMHGAILFIFAIGVCQFGERLAFFKPFYVIRYLLLLMGFFSLYCGFIYNDFTSIPLKMLGDSCFDTTATGKIPLKPDCIYSVGVDPAWFLGTNELTFMNSQKMKIAVILGVLQMSFGVFMKALNSLYFRRYVDFFFEFIPQIVLLLVLFGFMDLMIIIKWLTDYSKLVGVTPPSIITSMIAMSLNLGYYTDRSTPLFQNQTQIMQVLMIIAAICVPLMLLVKPIWENSRKHHPQKKRLIEDDGVKEYNAINDDTSPKHHDLMSIEDEKRGGKQQHGFSDLFIHQMIETIEFVLGTVSNTASYLRLWALSLAHSQLAKVFFDNTIKGALQSGSFISLFFGFYVFLGFTVSVLMMMDLMEAFLHTLRLHWVEFNNKFYKGGGIKFVAFSVYNVLQDAHKRDKEGN